MVTMIIMKMMGKIMKMKIMIILIIINCCNSIKR